MYSAFDELLTDDTEFFDPVEELYKLDMEALENGKS